MVATVSPSASAATPPSAEAGRPRLSLRVAALVFVAYVAFALYITWPLALHATHAVLTQAGQGDFTCWVNESQTMEGLVRGKTQFQVDFLPERYRYLDITDLVLNLPFRLLLPFPLHYNVTALVVLTLDAFCGFLLLFRLTGHLPVAFALGGMLAWNPMTVRELHDGRLHVATLFFLYLYVLQLYRVRDEGGRGKAVTLGLLLVLNCMTFWFFGFGAFFMTALFVLMNLRKVAAPGRFLRDVRLALFIAGLCIMPLFHVSRGFVGTDPRVVWFTPFPDIRHTDDPSPSKIVFFSQDWDFLWTAYAVLLLGATVPALLRRRVNPFYAVFLGFAYLANIGPLLKGHQGLITAGEEVVRLPYCLLYQWLPFFSRLHEPNRLEGFVLIALVLMLADNLVWVGRVVQPSRTGRAAFGVALAVLLLVPLFGGSSTYAMTRFSELYPYASALQGGRGNEVTVLALPCTGGAGEAREQRRIDLYWRDAFLMLAVTRRSFWVVQYAPEKGNAWSWHASFVHVLGLEQPRPPHRPDAVDLADAASLKGFDYVLLTATPALSDAPADLAEKSSADFEERLRVLQGALGPPLAVGSGYAVWSIR